MEFEEDNISLLSESSTDEIDKAKFELMGQYSCDECPEIPRLIGTDANTKTITLKCDVHGLKTLDINKYMLNSLNYNTLNWKCSNCENIQRYSNTSFKYCECGFVFCPGCFKGHKETNGKDHDFTISSEDFNLKCKKNKNHFKETYVGYCYDCKVQYCQICAKEGTHKWHEKVSLDSIMVQESDIEKIRELNKQYKKFIEYYQALIQFNELVINSFKKCKNNYYNLNNINMIIKNYDRKQLIDPLNDSENRTIIPGENNKNLFLYMNSMHKDVVKDQPDNISKIEINNKFFNKYDFNVLTQIPLTNLRLLSLENNAISKIDNLEYCNFDNLLILNLNNNAISDISILGKAKFDGLQALFLKNNSIKDIEIFGKKKFNYLRQLDLRKNVIENIGVFDKWEENLENLQSLYLSGNLYEKEKSKDTIEKIKKIPDGDY